MRLIHSRNGKFIAIDEAPIRDMTEAKPRHPQRLRLRLKSPVRHVLIGKSHTNYKAGFIHQLGDDQCRFTINDENRTMCGAKVVNGKSWCATHHKTVR